MGGTAVGVSFRLILPSNHLSIKEPAWLLPRLQLGMVLQSHSSQTHTRPDAIS